MNSRVAFDERHMEVVSLLVRWALCLYPEKPNRIDQERDCGDVVQAASAADEVRVHLFEFGTITEILNIMHD